MEREFLLFFHKTLANQFLDFLMIFFTTKGFLLLIPVFSIIFIKLLKDKKYLIILYLLFTLIVGLFLSDWISRELKVITGRVRPCWYIDFRPLVGCTSSFSFPSNHASNALIVASLLILFIKNNFKTNLFKKILYGYTLANALFICFSRVYLGVHWPTDVLAGAILGSALGFPLYKVATRINTLKGAFYFFLIILSLFRFYFILHGPLDLSPDEAHYWEWSRRLDLSYYSKGPMIAYLIALSTLIFGDNPFGVRALAVVFSFLSSFFIYKIGDKIFNKKVGYISGMIFQLIPLYAAYGFAFTIDSPFIFFWIVSIYIFLLALEGKNFYWIALGFFIGAGLLTKYTMAFFYICMFLYLIRKTEKSSALPFNNNKSFQISSYNLNNFKNPMLYFCLIVSLIIFSPVIIWNIKHDWVTLKHTAGQAHLYEGLRVSLLYFIEFIGGQILLLTPLFFLLGFYFLLKSSLLNLELKKRWFLLTFSMPVFVFFLLKSIQGKVQANWAMPAYIPLLILIAYAFETKIYKKIIISSIILASVLTVFSHALVFLNLPVNVDPSSRLKGWREIGVRVSEIKRELERDGKVIIFSDRYQISSELAFYVEGKPRVYCINTGRRMNQYDLWESINSELNSAEKVNGIYVIFGNRSEPEPEVYSAFEKCIHENFQAYSKGVKIRDYTIFKCYNFRGLILRKPDKY